MSYTCTLVLDPVITNTLSTCLEGERQKHVKYTLLLSILFLIFVQIPHFRSFVIIFKHWTLNLTIVNVIWCVWRHTEYNQNSEKSSVIKHFWHRHVVEALVFLSDCNTITCCKNVITY